MTRKILICFLYITLTPFLFAGGAVDGDGEYRAQLEESFNEIVYAIQAGTMDISEGKSRLSRLREHYNQPYNDEYGIIEALIDQVGENNLSADEAGLRFSLLQKGQLMEYRRDQQSTNSQTDKVELDNNSDNSGKGSDQGNKGDGQRKSNS